MKTKLKNYVEEYLKNSAAYDGAADFESYKAKNGKDYKSKYTNAVLEADARAKRALADYGNTASNLLDMGLTDSGYARRISSIAEEKREAEISTAEGEYRAKSDALLRGYIGYLEDYREGQEKLIGKVTDGIIKNGILNEEEAVLYGKSRGLSEARAKQAAERGILAQRDKLINQVVTDVTRYGVSADRARIYAASLGLDEKAIEYVARCAEAASNGAGASQSYEDYLKLLEELSQKRSSKI